MKPLKEFLKDNSNFLININPLPDSVVEVEQLGNTVEVRHSRALVSVEIFDSSDASKSPRLLRKVNATGTGKSSKEAERDGIRECLFRLGYV